MKFRIQKERLKPIMVMVILTISLIVSNGLVSKNSDKNNNYNNRIHSELVEGMLSKLPLDVSDEAFKPLSNHLDLELQFELEKIISNNTYWKNLVARKKMSFGVVDLTNPSSPRFASINGDEMMYAASLPKIAVLLATEDALENNEINESKQIHSDMRLMISKSNNQATTRLIDLVGYDKIESVLTDPEYNLYDVDNGGGLWVGKRYAASGPTNREPLKNLSHAASVDQVCRFYYLLAHGKLISKERSKHMLDMMENPALHHKFVNTLQKIAPNAQLFRKSGSWKNWHSDSVLVWDEERKYILVALVENENGEQIIRNLVKPVEKVLNINPNAN